MSASPVLDVQILDRPVEAVAVEPFPGGAGAECAFLGRTRADVHPRHGRLVKLVYSAYAPLAQATLRALAEEAARRYECSLVRVHHAVGEVPVGRPSVLVQVTSAHRDRAFEACRFIIDRLKATAPIWKKEQWTGGTTWSAGHPVHGQGDRASSVPLTFDLPRKTDAQRERARQIYQELARHYPDAHCELDYRNPHELLIATILSAQALDTSVNKATPALFAAFPKPADYAAATPKKIEPYVKSLGFFRNKALAIHAAMKTVCDEFGGRVPDTMEGLLKLRGVARKTANVVLGNAYGVNEGVVVDTHVIRLAQRLGLSRHKDPKKIELDLMALFPRDTWTMLSHMLIWHGRRVCKARGALCAEHPICRAYCSNARVKAPAKKVSSTRRGARAGPRPRPRARSGAPSGR